MSLPDIIMNDDNTIPKIFGPFTGGSNTDTSSKLTELYNKIRWNADTTNPDNEFFYVMNVNNEIIGSVRICNSVDPSNHYKLEIGYDLVDNIYRGKKIYNYLCERRLKYIRDTKTNMYMSYTEHDYVKNTSIKFGMTLISENKIQILGDHRFYWALEYNRNAKTLYIETKFQNKNLCRGIMFGKDDDINCGYAISASHCFNIRHIDEESDYNPIKITYPLINKDVIVYNRDVSANYCNYKQFPPNYNVNIDRDYIIGYEFFNTDETNRLDEFDDTVIYKTTPVLDTINISMLTNPEDLPVNQSLIFLFNNNDGYISVFITEEKEKDFFNEKFFNDGAMYKESAETRGMNADNCREYIRVVELTDGTFFNDKGYSGSSVGIKYGLDNKKFAIVGIVSTTYSDNSSTCSIINVSKKIDWLNTFNIKFNKSRYNTQTRQIEDI
jgi:hypothetical protein